jgi:excinuclease UvrABC nuclease subunit
MQWDSRDGSDTRVVDRGGWCELGSIGSDFPDRVGVYVFADATLQVKYVGEAGQGRLRVAALDSVRRGEARAATQATWLARNSEATEQSLERVLIGKYGNQRIYSKQH